MKPSPTYIYISRFPRTINVWVLSGGSVRLGGGHLGGLLLYLFWAINLWYSIWESNCSSSCLVRSASWWFPTAKRNVHVTNSPRLAFWWPRKVCTTYNVVTLLKFFGHATLHYQGSFNINVTLMYRDRWWMALIVIGQTTLHSPRLKGLLIFNLRLPPFSPHLKHKSLSLLLTA